MKETSKEFDNSNADVIFEDEEMVPLFRAIIEKGKEKRYNRSHIVQALLAEWSRVDSISRRIRENPTEEEIDFWEKANMFVDDYSEEILTAYNKYHREPHLDDLSVVSDNIKNIICAAYCLFCRDDTITEFGIEKYAERVIGVCVYDISDTVYTLGLLIQFEIEFDYHTHSPIKGGYVKNQIRPYDIPSHTKFFSKYKFKSTRLARSVLSIVWFIETYY